jgi:hypothetical protein
MHDIYLTTSGVGGNANHTKLAQCTMESKIFNTEAIVTRRENGHLGGQKNINFYIKSYIPNGQYKARKNDLVVRF